LLQPSKPPANSRMNSNQLHIEMLLDNYEALRHDNCEILLPSSNERDPSTAKESSTSVFQPLPKNGVLPPCLDPGCASLGVIEDVNSGSVVCTQCGLIQSTVVFESASTDALYHEGVSRTAVRRYSRIVYLRSVLRSTCGDTQLDLLPAWKTSLLLYFQSDETPKTAIQIKKAIQHLKLPKKLLFHSQLLASTLFGTKCPNPSEYEIRSVCARFHALENAWDRQPLEGSVRKGRKKFLSLPVVWEVICQQLHLPTLSELIPPTKNEKLRTRQLQILAKLDPDNFTYIKNRG
jgi:hypothetical protein